MDDALAVLPVGAALALAALVLLVVGLGVLPRGGLEPGEVRPVAPEPAGGSPTARLSVGIPALVVALVLVLLARRGGPETDNAASLVVAGLGLPVALLLAVLSSPLTRRAAARGDVGDVRPALLPATLLAGALVVPGRPAAPSWVALCVGTYALLVVAAGTASGRTAVARVDLLGLLARWAALGPRLVAWAPPQGAAAVLALVLGACAAERWERTTSWQTAGHGELGSAVLLLALAAVALAAAGLLSRVTPPGTVAAVLVPLLVGAVLGALVRRALISAQLLVDLVRSGDQSVTPDPLGVAGGQALAVGLVVAGTSAALAVLARRCGPGGARVPGLLVLVTLGLALCGLVLQT